MRWMWSAAALAVLAGCSASWTVSETTCERMFRPLMSDVQRAEYYKRQTWAERKAYLYEIQMMQKYEAAPPEIQSAIRNQSVIRGMNPEQVTMSWGPPHRIEGGPVSTNPAVVGREGRKELWLYFLVLSPWEFTSRYRRAVEFTNDVVVNVREGPPK